MFRKLYKLIVILRWLVLIKAEILMPSEAYKLDMIDLLGLDNPPKRLSRQISLDSSASKFLLEAYNMVNDKTLNHLKRPKRSILNETNFLTDFDRWEIEKCNNIITFSSKHTPGTNYWPEMKDMTFTFNTNYVAHDLKLIHAILRLYQQPSLGKYEFNQYRAWITIYYRAKAGNLKALTSLNTTTTYEGWLAFGATEILEKWLKHKTASHRELLVSVTLAVESLPGKFQLQKIPASDLGLIQPNTSSQLIELEPFIVGYFTGPELWQKTQKLRLRRDVRKSPNEMHLTAWQPVKSNMCQLINLSFNLDTYLKNDLIAPKIIDAYFCGGACDFPLNAHLNATNHAIIQTLMHLKNSTMPKVKCVPTALGSISVLHYVNEDSVHLSKFDNMVAKACGCH